MAVVKTINLDAFAKEFGRGVQGDAKFLKRQKRLIYDATYDGILRSIEPMKERSPVDTGAYQSSWGAEKVSKNEIHFGNTIPYAVNLEFGAEPFSPPIEPLLEWAGRKLKKPTTNAEVHALAWGVKRKFEREGSPPRHILEKGLEEVILPYIKVSIERKSKNRKYGEDDANNSL